MFFHHRRRYASLALALGLLASAAIATEAPIVGTARVIDGDTIEIGGKKIRLDGIDAPELKQTCINKEDGDMWPCGFMVGVHLDQFLEGRTVSCAKKANDKYGRVVGKCFVEGQDISAHMVKMGLAFAYRKYSDEYVPLEKEARAQKTGIWSSEVVEPWEWRKQ